jgi:hypothetical protein
MVTYAQNVKLIINLTSLESVFPFHSFQIVNFKSITHVSHVFQDTDSISTNVFLLLITVLKSLVQPAVNAILDIIQPLMENVLLFLRFLIVSFNQISFALNALQDIM